MSLLFKLLRGNILFFILCLIPGFMLAGSDLSFQGRLTDKKGVPYAGTPTILVNLFTTKEGGTSIWTSQEKKVDANEAGLFSTEIESFPAELLNIHEDLFIEISVFGRGTFQPLYPRQRLNTVPYAIQAEQAKKANEALSIADDAVTSQKIDDGEVTSDDLGPDSVTGHHIDNGAVGPLDLSTDAVRSSHILDEAIDAVDLATDAVRSANILDHSIQEIDLAPDSVHTLQIATNAVTGNKVALGEITKNHLNPDLQKDLIPSRMVAMFSGDCPDGWAPLANSAGRFPIGIDESHPFTQGGTRTIEGISTFNDGPHVHQINSHDHNLRKHVHGIPHRHVSPVAVNDKAPAAQFGTHEYLDFPYDGRQWGQGHEFISVGVRARVAPLIASDGTVNYAFLKTKDTDTENSGPPIPKALIETDPDPTEISDEPDLETRVTEGPHTHGIEPYSFLPPYFGIQFCIKN
ncbi:hypothetical protein BVX98_04955 [bacterium F11]|nr:hypothetical protein BVX98_04955 [bacterium F11]